MPGAMIVMTGPTVWPFPPYHVIPSRLMPSGRHYTLDSNNQISADPADVSVLMSFGFFPVGIIRGLPGGGDATKFLDGTGALSTPTGGGGGGSLLSLAMPVSSAQILNSNTTPVEIIPAPGAGKFITLFSLAWQYKAGLAYSQVNGSDVYASSDLTTDLTGQPPEFLGTTTDTVIQQAVGNPIHWGINSSSLVFYSQFASPINGTGSLVIFVDYLIKTAQQS